MKYRCLIVDHDDTVVNSTATIHYPSFLAYMQEYHPEIRCSLEDYFVYNFDPGVIGFFRDICGLNDDDLKMEESYWKNYVRNYTPSAYPGIREVLQRHVDEGGILCVASHSFTGYIERDYKANGLPMPHRIFGWDMPAELRKPHPYTVQKIMEEYSLKPSDCLVLDDLKPGYEMARAAGVTFAAAGWANDIPQIEGFMRQNCDIYFKTIEELRHYLYD